MKKYIFALMAVMLIVLFQTSCSYTRQISTFVEEKAASVNVTEKPVSIQATEKPVRVYVDDKIINFKTPPQIVNGRTLVPLREISEALGADISWDGDNQEAILFRGGVYVRLEIGSDTMLKGTYIINEQGVYLLTLSRIITLDSKAALLDSRTFVPLRAISEGFSAGVDWNAEQRAVYITSSPEDATAIDPEDEALLRPIIDQIIKPGMSDYEKEKAVHDYIVLNSKYDHENYLQDSMSLESYTIQGLIKNKTGGCEAYSKTFQAFMTLLGIESELVRGMAGGEPHMWNRVKLDGDYYFVDVTWNDPVMEDGGEVLRYGYFNLNDSQLAKSHNWERNDSKKCTATKYNYYEYNKMVIISQGGFNKRVGDAYAAGEESVTMRGEEINVNSLDLEKIFEVTAVRNYSYSIDDEQNIITIYFK